MIDQPSTGHEGPYDAPIRVTGRKVLPEWIDYNGHMNVAYYTVAVDTALDVMLEEQLGIGETFAAESKMGIYALQAHYTYLAEMREADAFSVQIRLLDHDAKRLHVFLELVRDSDNETAATVETMLMNVDHSTRRSAPYPEWAQRRMSVMKSAHAALPQPEAIGAKIGLRRT